MVEAVRTEELVQALPGEVVAVLQQFYTAELTTMGKSGVPVTWPIMPIFWARKGLFVSLTSIGLPQKAFNVRRDPRVALLFSEPVGSDLERPPAVLVQGVASAPDRVITSREDSDPALYEAIVTQAQKMLQRQPAASLYMSSRLTRYLMDWYFMRLPIMIRPERIWWWQDGDFAGQPQQMEVADVGANIALFA